MNPFSGIEIREIPLNVPSARREWVAMLESAGLLPDRGVEYALGAYDANDRLVATAGLDKSIIKDVAIDPSLQGENIAGALMSRLISHSAESGVRNLSVFTKPEYLDTFRSLGFKKIGASPGAVFLEFNLRDLESYKAYLKEEEKSQKASQGENIAENATENGATGGNAAIVMNCNPLTIGHLHLIREAASRHQHLFIIPLDENSANFLPLRSRENALRKACAEIPGVTVLRPSRYCISSATFPSYFIKDADRRSDAQMLLDLDIFARHIAPSLGVTVRYAGSEPSDPLTARYNTLMAATLPKFGIEFREIPRLCLENSNGKGHSNSKGEPVSASSIRKAITEGPGLASRISSLSPYAIPGVLAAMASMALEKELSLSPKPGLVDTIDNGSHRDMDLPLMRKSISSLSPYFEKIAEISLTTDLPDYRELASIGIEAEQAMLSSTSGINTHRGALFCMGLAVAASAHVLFNSLDTARIPDLIASLASRFPRPDATHGAEMARKFSIPTALDMALSGYSQVFTDWRKESDPLMRLLRIMSQLDDSNVYYRAGREGAQLVKESSSKALLLPRNEIETEMKRLNSLFISRNISPGGAADMLALSFFFDFLVGDFLAGDFPAGDFPVGPPAN